VNRVAQQPTKAFATALAAVALLSIMDAVMKHLVLVIGIIAVSIWRSFANFLISAILYLPGPRRRPDRATLRIHVWRGILVTVMAFLFFWALGRVPLAQAIALTFIAPLISLVLAAVFLGEHIGRRSIGGSVAAFAGVVVIVLGQARAQVGPDVLLGSAAIICSALCYAGNIVMMRRQALAAGPQPSWRCGSLRWLSSASLHRPAGSGLGSSSPRCCRRQVRCSTAGPMRAARRAISR
jgi:S-adenosylmethionine uptake transporter